MLKVNIQHLYNINILNILLSANLIGSSHQHFEILDSTNLAATQLIAKARPKEGLVISADAQTAGVGQIGSAWHSEYAKNCLFSVIVYPSFLKAEQGFYLQMMVCNAMRKAMAELIPTLDFTIKWPNDLYCKDKKIAGLLIQTAVRGYYLDYAVIGIGMNVNQTAFPMDIGNPASLRSLSHQEFSRSKVMSDMLFRLDASYEFLKMNHSSATGMSSILDEFEQNLYLLNQRAIYKDLNNVQLELYLEGVKPDGRLILKDKAGKQRLYNFKEIKLLPQIFKNTI